MPMPLRVLPLLAAVLLVVPASAQIVVNSVADVAADDGACTLREAIVASNTDTASGTAAGECAAGSGDDTVTLALPPGSVLLLTASLPVVTESWTLEGPTSRADGVVVDGADAHRIFELDSNGEQQTHTLRGLTVRHGLSPAGGGILVGYQDHCVFEDLAVVDNVATNGAGGIYTGEEGTCTMDRVYVARNEAQGPSGAGGIRISNGTTATIRNATVADNVAAGTGGGILVGRFSPPVAEFTLFQSTVSGNVAAGGGGGIRQIGANGTSVVRASTIVGNSVTESTAAGGGVGFDWDVVFESTIIAGNSAVRGPEWADLSLGVSATTSNGGNVIGVNGLFVAEFPEGQPNANGDLVGTTAAPFDPALESLADNGGPMPTHLPLPGSPILDMGVCTGEATDQRGAPREVDEPAAPNGNGDACDPGAAEGTKSYVSLEPGVETPGLRLDTPAPNPMSGTATVRFVLASPARVRLSVVDVLGREVAVLDASVRPAGMHTARLDARALAPGVYVLRLVTDVGVRTRRLTVVR